MATVYLIRHDNVSPDALQSTHNPSTYTVQTDPPTGNSGNHPVITEGWMGTTSDHSRTALGEFDLAEGTDRQHLADALVANNISTSVKEIATWADAEGGEMPLDMDDPYTYTRSCKYNIESEDGWWPILNDGWNCLDSYASGNYGNDSFGCGLDVAEIRRRLDDSGISYDEISECNRDSGGTSEMICFHVRAADHERAIALLEEESAVTADDE